MTSCTAALPRDGMILSLSFRVGRQEAGDGFAGTRLEGRSLADSSLWVYST